MAAIIIVGLGPGPSEALTLEAREALLHAEELHLPGGYENSCVIDGVVHRCPQSPDVDAAILACHVVQRAEAGANITVGIPGDPADWQALLAEMEELASRRGIVVRRVSGVSIVSVVLDVLGLVMLPGLFVTTAAQLSARNYPVFLHDCPALVMWLRSNHDVAVLQKMLLKQYQPDFRVALVHGAGQKGEIAEWVLLGELHLSVHISQTSALFLPARDEMDSFADLQAVVAQLRGPDGCPWDREQTHRSLRVNLLEEAYETLAAIETGDPAMLAEELGDLLLQVVLHTQIAVDENEFDMATVVAGINNKLVRRHPHVFAGLSVDGVEDVLLNWDEIKAAENKTAKKGDCGMLSGIPVVLPALAQAQTYQRRAARAGFEGPEISGIVEKIRTEIEVLSTARGIERKNAETGDLLFALVNLACCLDVDAETALREASARFRSRFEAMEAIVREQGGSIRERSSVELDVMWERVKDTHPSR